MVHPPARQRPGFTLIELMIVVAIIAVLIALLLPGLQKVREAGSRSQCANNLKEMGLALQNYQMRSGQFPAGFYNGGNSLAPAFTNTGWQLQLLPYLDQMALWNQSVQYLTQNPGGTDNQNFPAVNYKMDLFICPSNIRAPTMNDGPAQGCWVNFEVTSYMGCTGTVSNSASPGGLLYYNSTIKLDQITDGVSRTIAVGERPATPDLVFGWGFAPYGLTGCGDGDTVIGSSDAYMAAAVGDNATNIGLQPPSTPYATSGEIDIAHFWSYHPGGAYFLMCDGSVQFLSYSANNVFPALCTIAGGENFTLPF